MLVMTIRGDSTLNQAGHRFRLHPTLPWKVLAHRVSYEIFKDNVFGRAAELAYFFLFSLLPLLLVLSNLLGLVSDGRRIQQDMLRYFSSVMPWTAYRLLATTLDQVVRSSGGAKLSLGILITLATASNGMVAIIEGLNTAYEVKEGRSWWKRRVVALALTLGLAILTITALAMVLYGTDFGGFLTTQLGFGRMFESAWRVVQWPLVAAFVLLAFTLVYRFAPNVKDQRWHWILPGAVVAFLLWLLASFGLRLYLQLFNSFPAMYGSLGAVMVLMLWLYLFGTAVLIGGEVNSIVEQSAARAGDPEAKLPGEKAPGEAERPMHS
jgi:membrane protein